MATAVFILKLLLEFCVCFAGAFLGSAAVMAAHKMAEENDLRARERSKEDSS